MTKYYYERRTMGKWTPATSTERPGTKKAEGVKGPAIRRVHEVPEHLNNLTLSQLQEHFKPAFIPTHLHVRTGKEYRVTSVDERREVTGDDTYLLTEYEDAAGEKFSQDTRRFFDGRFAALPAED